jgi:hypothetical protein
MHLFYAPRKFVNKSSEFKTNIWTLVVLASICFSSKLVEAKEKIGHVHTRPSDCMRGAHTHSLVA